MKKTLSILLVSFLVVVVVYYLGVRLNVAGALFPPPPGPDTIVVTKIIPGDPVLVEIETTVPYPVLIDTGAFQIVEVPREVDTAEILADYFRTRQYTDTLTDDTSFRAVYSAKVHRNRLAAFNYQHQNLRQTAIYQTNIIHYNRALMVGADMMLAPDRFNIGPSLLYVNKRESYSLSVGLLRKEFRFGYHRSLWMPEKPP